MPCKHHKDALIEAAANGAQPQGDLRVHLAACAPCRAAFEQEQSLLASIDAGLQATANARVPASLLPRVRARLDEGLATQRRWLQLLIFATAGAALAFALFLLSRPHVGSPNSQAKQTPQIAGSETLVKNARPPISGPAAQVVSSNVNNSPTRGHSTFLRLVASSQPEVLVPPDEREAFARFVVLLQKRREVAVALVTPSTPTTKDVSAGLELLQVNGLEIKPLEERQTEVSDGAEREQ
jgi:hypothetical protein